MESNENFYSYYDYDQDQDASNDQNKDPGANQYDYAEGGSYDNYYGQQNEAGAIPTMTASTGAPKDPYEPEYEESKSEKLKKLQKNRFQSVMPGMEEINDGMRNMNIVDNSNQTMDMAQVPRDMYMGPSTMDPSSRGGIIPSSYGSSGSDSSLLKPKVFLNEESVRRGVMMQYRTDKMELPPSSTMPFSVSDQGICSPKLMRPTMYRIPNSSTLHQSSKIPMGLIVQPMADIGEGESEIPIAECGIEGPVRCTACGGYVNPGTQFLENCASARCNFCGSIFPVSDTKYGFANDPSSFPELSYPRK